MEDDSGKFKLIQRVSLDDLNDGTVKEIPESDLCIQTATHIIQFEYEDSEEDKTKYTIKPGVFTLTKTMQGVGLSKLELKTHDLLESATNTAMIKKEANLFFSKLDIYKKFNKAPKRAILLYSSPGLGKSACIAKLSQEFIKEDSGTVVIFWDTSDLSPSSISKFLQTGSRYSKKCTRLLFIMEDIGGGNVEGYGGPKSADAGLLELLDGSAKTFKQPTFIIATTNTPENLLQSLADRPGRFDQMFELEHPKGPERVLLARHIGKRELTPDEIAAFESKDADGLSIAHISEVIVRSELHDKSFADVIIEMKEHKVRIEKAFQKAKKGLGLI